MRLVRRYDRAHCLFRINEPRAVSASRRAALFCGLAVCFAAVPALSQTAEERKVRLHQEMLIWTTDYEGLIDGRIGQETTKAINKFQGEKLKNPQTGVLTPAEEAELIRRGRSNKERAGFEPITDNDAGVSIGLPRNFVSGPTKTKWGKHWYGRTAGLAIDTLRFGEDVSLRQLYERLRSINNRTVPYERFVEDSWFVISAFKKGDAVYVRANLVKLPNRPTEIRGFSIWMSDKRPPEYHALAPAISSSFKWHTGTAPQNTTTATPPATSPIGGTLVPPPTVPRNLPPDIQPIRTDGPAPSGGECFRGLGPSWCPEVLSYR
jgi:hypothetical protein